MSGLDEIIDDGWPNYGKKEGVTKLTEEQLAEGIRIVESMNWDECQSCQETYLPPDDDAFGRACPACGGQLVSRGGF